MNYANPDALVSTAWLAEHLVAPDVRIVDGTNQLPGSDLDPKEAYAQQHIPGAVFFDIGEIADTDSLYPNMLPPPEKFASRVSALGLGDGSRIVVYDAAGLVSAARVWWMFRYFGHKDIAILDGGLPKWIRDDHPVDDKPVHPSRRHFTPRVHNFLVRNTDQVLANLDSGREQVIDTRSAARYSGEVPEARPGLRAGHIPKSLNLPYPDILDPEEKTLLPADALKRKFDALGIDLKRPIVTSCGSGVTAGVVAFGLYLLGVENVPVYDGSWSEWGSRDDLPMEP
ncbi:MAG: 3-mercaptopyruvate sulfurtransferase [Alphaproteobacteria bacterium]|nr:3-mercaptopyruvate sulfurtransferase [Alphaproteobacteria bacterium]